MRCSAQLLVWVGPMDACSTESEISYFDAPPVLIAGSSEAAIARALSTVTASGARIAGKINISHPRERRERQVSTSTLWIELDEDRGEPVAELLAQVSSDVADGRYSAVVSAPAAMLDAVAAKVDASAGEVIVNADDAARAAAWAL